MPLLRRHLPGLAERLPRRTTSIASGERDNEIRRWVMTASGVAAAQRPIAHGAANGDDGVPGEREEDPKSKVSCGQLRAEFGPVHAVLPW